MPFAPVETTAASVTHRLAEPLELPDLPAAPARRPFPLVASIVPVIGAVVMWQVTGSVFMLWFAALGPFMAVASLVDGARGARRERRIAERELAAACERVRQAVETRHAEERELRRATTPDAARAAAHDGWLWRRQGPLVIGVGRAESLVRVTGGEGEAAEQLRRDAAGLPEAPVTVEWENGVCVRGDDVAARAVVRALVVQLILRHPPSAVRLLDEPLGESWAEAAPHRAADVAPDAAKVAVILAGDPVPAGADAVIALARPGEPIPHECAALVEMASGLNGALVADGGDIPLALEAVSQEQAQRLAGSMASRERQSATTLPQGPIPLAHVLSRGADEHDADRAPAGLRAVVGLAAHLPDETPDLVALDLVADGPHAVVVGTTGAGKSEFLTTWIASIAAHHAPEQVVFLLGDFKGGTAFDHLQSLPHVTGVLTDLDGGGARRAVEGLRAEIRRRERAIAGAGARDIGDPRVRLARLVIVIDEFAALLQENPDLHQVFTDVAARGRALGMHLVLGTQRASGILRDALLANSPLRVALRVAEDRESSQLVGTDLAARIPGDAAHRGIGYVRRAGDVAASVARFALTRPDDVVRIEKMRPGAAPVAGPLLAPLPREWRPVDPVTDEASIVLGLADDPAEQRQIEATLRPGTDRGVFVIGGAGSGKSSLARWVAGVAREHGRRVISVPRDNEGAWDALAAAEQDPPELFVVDDADALLARFPAEYAQVAGERLETIVRDAGATGTTIVLTAARLSGAVSKIAEVMPRRAVLSLATVHDHLAAGADRALFDAARPPGRAVLDGYDTQLALPPDEPEPRPEDDPIDRWHPSAGVTGLVLRAAVRRMPVLRAAWEPEASLVLVDELPPGADLEELAAEKKLVICGDGDAWQRQYALLQRVRSSGDMVVGSDCASELRTIVGERELPPYARPRAARAWLIAAGEAPERIVLP